MREIGGNEDRKLIGGYEIISVIAKGGMGIIYKGHDSILNRYVVIKVLAREFADDQDAIKRFEREAKAVSKLRHPNIAVIHSIGKTDENLPYLIMELIDGLSFAQIIENKVDFKYSKWCDLMIQAAEGLRAAYRQNIIHRDIKPGNIMLNRDDIVKIVDFGLAKIIREDTYKTSQGTVLGTPRYMAPEQGLGRNVDHRADIYSLGATFYHILAQQPPFEADSSIALMMKHTSTPLTPIYLVNPKVPIDLCNVIQKMMSKEVNDRYHDYDDLINALKDVKLARLAQEKGAQELPQQSQGGRNDAVYGIDFNESKDPLFDDAQPSVYGINSPDRMPPTQRMEPKLEIRHDNIPDYNIGNESESAANQQASSTGGSGEIDPLFEEGFGGYVQKSPAAGGKKYIPEVEDRKVSEANYRYVILGIAIFLLFLGALAFMYTQISGDSLSDETKEKGFIAKILIKVFPDLKKKREKSPEYTAEAAIETTKNNLEISFAAIEEFEAKTGNFPDKLNDLVEKNLCKEENLYDGWNGRFIFIPSSRRLISLGIDKQENTSDDFYIDKKGIRSPSPAVMEKMLKMDLDKEFN